MQVFRLINMETQSGHLQDGSVIGRPLIYHRREGAGDLKDGLHEFNEEAVQKVLKYLNGDLTGLVDRARAMINVAKGYAGYAGIAAGKQGVTQFVIKTAGI